jgi:hypothetical protein
MGLQTENWRQRQNNNKEKVISSKEKVFAYRKDNFVRLFKLSGISPCSLLLERSLHTQKRIY